MQQHRSLSSRLLVAVAPLALAMLAWAVPAHAQVAFLPATNFAVGSNPPSVAVGDFNGDGKPDLAVANQTSNTVSIRLGTGTGSFGAATNFTAGTNPRSVAVGDFNGDGKIDLAVANQAGNNVSILLGTGSGSFGAATNFVVGTNPFFVAVGDFNGDGRPDLAVANLNSNNVSILLGTGTGAGACCNGTTCTLVSGAAACIAPATYLGNGTACAPLGRNGAMNACCPADFNNSGGANVQDIFDFLAAWFAGCP